MLDNLAEKFNRVMKEIEEDQEQWWNSLSKEDQLKAFCAVARRIHKGELEDKGTYRWVLYDVFGFGPEAYAPAQMAGYLDIHNSIVDSEYDTRLIRAFCQANKIENYEEKIQNWVL